MFISLKKYLLVVLLSLTSTFANAGLIFQDDFEDGSLSPWVIGAGAPWISNVEAHSGQYSVAAMGNDQMMISFLSTAVDEITELSIWIKRETSIFDHVTLFYSDATSNVTFTSQANPNNEWIKFDFVEELTAGKSLVGFAIYGTSPGPAYFDDFTLMTNSQSVPEPSMIAIFALSMFVFAVRRYSK